jgi:hypothetical protein
MAAGPGRRKRSDTVQIGESLTFVFREPSWLKKVVILALLFFVPIIGWLAIGGYLLQLVRNVSNGVSPALPEWDDFGGKLAGGLKVWLVSLVWNIPASILQSLDNSVDGFFIWLVSTVVSMVTTLFVISAIGGLAQQSNLADAFAFSAVIGRVKSNPGAYVIAALMSAVWVMLALIGLVGLLVGVVFTLAIALVAGSHLSGQAHRIATHGSVAPAYQPRF